MNRLPIFLILLLAFFPAKLSAFYDPGQGRWLNRDPIGEAGGRNLMGFVRNNPVRVMDRLGLEEICDSCNAAIRDYGSNPKIKGQLELLAAKKPAPCPIPKISCRCKKADNHGKEEFGGGKYNGIANEITLFCNSTIGSSSYMSKIIHEMGHAVDRCYRNRPENSCKDRACTELRAYTIGDCATIQDPTLKRDCIFKGTRASLAASEKCPEAKAKEAIIEALKDPQCSKGIPPQPRK